MSNRPALIVHYAFLFTSEGKPSTTQGSTAKGTDVAIVSLSDLVEDLKREVNLPGADIYTNASEDDYVGHLSDGFWEAYLDGLLASFQESEGDVTPRDGIAVFTRDLQQIVVMYAGMRIVRTALYNSQTSFRAEAGPVSYETGISPTVLTALLQELKERRTRLLHRLQDAGVFPYFIYIDAIAARDASYEYGSTYWVN